MKKASAGLLLYRRGPGGRVEVFLVHPGGPFWAARDAGAWSIPKGELADGEDGLAAAIREFTEETGQQVHGEFTPLQPVKQPGGKTVHAWAVEAECDPERLVSNTFSMEWPPKSGHRREFPEIDRAGWFPLSDARTRLLAGQVPLLDQLAARLDPPSSPFDASPL